MSDKTIPQLTQIDADTELLDTNLDETSLNPGSRFVSWLTRMRYIRAALGFGGATPNAARTLTTLIKEITGIASGTDTIALTVTIPNGVHQAAIRVMFMATKGAGGAVGEGESAGVFLYHYIVTRTPGVSAKMAQVQTGGGAVATVTGGAAINNAIDDGGMLAGPSGGSTGTQTYDIRVNIGSSQPNNKCTVYVETLNHNASGVTVA